MLKSFYFIAKYVLSANKVFHIYRANLIIFQIISSTKLKTWKKDYLFKHSNNIHCQVSTSALNISDEKKNVFFQWMYFHYTFLVPFFASFLVTFLQVILHLYKRTNHLWLFTVWAGFSKLFAKKFQKQRVENIIYLTYYLR